MTQLIYYLIELLIPLIVIVILFTSLWHGIKGEIEYQQYRKHHK